MNVTWAGIRKFLAALTGAVGVALSIGLLPEPWDKWVPGVLAVLTAFTVYLVPNAEPQPQTIGGTAVSFTREGNGGDHRP